MNTTLRWRPKVHFLWESVGRSATSEQTALPWQFWRILPSRSMVPSYYCAAQHDGTCSAAPIHDRDGRIIGVLNMAGKDWLGTLHTPGLVALATFSIENQLTLLHSYRLVDTAISSISEGYGGGSGVMHQRIPTLERRTNFACEKRKFVGSFQFQHGLDLVTKNCSSFTEESLHFLICRGRTDCREHHISCNVISIFPIVVRQHPEEAVLLLRRVRSINALA